ncbi:hypothetical protein [Kitasatospora brasiliensis]|uniref:hypothetical protein n=1 Tax=Kitasatospora brasiliensis TaxID=3058040 RepID=UPI002931705D|nr:hypothetical protein [Kitasatospora sp. K002]
MLDTSPDLRRDDRPAPPDVRGDFEVHLTVEAGAAGALAAWAEREGLKFTQILLARGAVPSQPMLTLRVDGTLEEVATATSRTADRLARAGFAVLRAKIEATPWAQGVPVSDADAVPHGGGRYFEHHVKLLLPGPTPGPTPGTALADRADRADAADPARLAALTELVVRHDAHLSRNPRRVREDGRCEWFVTQRCRLVGLDTAGRRLEALLGGLTADGREVVSVEREFVVVDSDEALDAGWITEHGQGHGARPNGEGEQR